MNVYKKQVIAIIIMTITCFYYFFDPASFHLGLPCIMKTATGWDCWGCGGQRAFHELLHGHFQKALYLNALVFPVVIILAYVGISAIFNQQPPSYKFLRRKPIQFSTVTILIAFTILRNVIK